MKTTDTNNEVAIQTPLIDILRSVPKSCREMIQDGEHSHRNIPYGRLCHEAATELSEKTNEVARLRELLNRAIGYTKNALFFARTYDNKIQWNEIDKLWDGVRDLEKETLAPAPEETVTEKASKFSVNPSFYEKCNVCGESYGDHTGHPDDPHCPLQEPVDYWKCPHCGSTTGTWFSRVEPMGDICEDCGRAVDYENWNLKEIPQEEKAPNHLHAWMRLQEGINKDISVEPQNLRDEIQKLKQK